MSAAGPVLAYDVQCSSSFLDLNGIVCALNLTRMIIYSQLGSNQK